MYWLKVIDRYLPIYSLHLTVLMEFYLGPVTECADFPSLVASEGWSSTLSELDLMFWNDLEVS